MSRLIDADALPIKFDGHTVSVWKNDIDNAPTVDAVPVVRCKNCRFRQGEKEGFCYGIERYVLDDDYCSRGERKEDGEE